MQFTWNLLLALFVLRWVQVQLVRKDSPFGEALSYLLH